MFLFTEWSLVLTFTTNQFFLLRNVLFVRHDYLKGRVIVKTKRHTSFTIQISLNPSESTAEKYTSRITHEDDTSGESRGELVTLFNCDCDDGLMPLVVVQFRTAVVLPKLPAAC